MPLDIISTCDGCGELETECKCVWLCEQCQLVCTPTAKWPCHEHRGVNGVRCERLADVDPLARYWGREPGHA